METSKRLGLALRYTACEGNSTPETRIRFIFFLFLLLFILFLISNPGRFQLYHIAIKNKKRVSFERLTLRQSQRTHVALQSKQQSGETFPHKDSKISIGSRITQPGARERKPQAESSPQGLLHPVLRWKAALKLKHHHPDK